MTNNLINTENKKFWCEAFGLEVEKDFVTSRLFELGIVGYINPSKRSDKYTHDLFMTLKCDVKTVRTPFFKSRELYGIDPQYCVTFNHKDGERYFRLYPNILVVFDVMWEKENCKREVSGKVYEVEPMRLTAIGFLSDIWRAIQKNGGHSVRYQRRILGDSGNAKSSFLFDVRNLHVLMEEPQ